jgi:hypothetical protein
MSRTEVRVGNLESMRRRAATCLVVLLACASDPSANSNGASGRLDRVGSSTDQPVAIEVAFTKTRWIVDESVELRVKLTNHTGSPIELEDPNDNRNRVLRYVVTGPSLSGELVIDADRASNPSLAPSEGAPRLRLASRRSLKVEIPISSWIPRLDPGSYELVVELHDGPLRARSRPASFSVEGPVVASASLGLDESRVGGDTVAMALVMRGPSSLGLYTASAYDRGSGSVAAGQRDLRRGELPNGVRKVVVPWSNADRTSSLSAWLLLIGTDALYGDSHPHQPLAVWPVPRGIRVLEPAFRDDREAMDVLVLEPGGKQLQLLRWTGTPPETSPAAAAVWKSDVRPEIVQARLSLGAKEQGSPRRIIALEHDDAGHHAALFVIDGGRDGRPRRRVPLPEGRPLADSLAHRVSTTGVSRGRVLVLKARDAAVAGAKVDLILVAIDVDAASSSVQERVVGALDVEPVASAIAFPVDDRDTTDVVWAVVLDSNHGEVLAGRDGRAQRVRLGGPPMQPLMLFAHGREAFIAMDGRDGPQLVSLPHG